MPKLSKRLVDGLTAEAPSVQEARRTAEAKLAALVRQGGGGKAKESLRAAIEQLSDALSGVEGEGEERFLWDDEVKGFGVRIKPSGSKSFVLKYRLGSKTKRHTICQVGSPYTVEQAREVARDLLRGLKSGVDPAAAKAARRAELSISELADLYLEEGPTLRPNKKASSWASDRSMLLRHVRPLLGKRMVSEITRADIAKFQHDVASGKTAKDEKTKARGRARVRGGPRAASLATATLRAMLQFGADTGRSAQNPARGVELLRSKSRERFLSELEVTYLAEAIASLEADALLNGAMADALRLLMLTGARRSEVLKLRWEWVDFERKCLRLPDSKTGAKVVPLASAALQILNSRKSKDGYVFPAGRGEGHAVGIQKAWVKVKAKATLIAREAAEDVGTPVDEAPDLRDVRLHDLRHSFASFAVADGASLFLIGKVLGHRQARTTEVYAHLKSDPIQSLAERTGKRIAEAMKPRPPKPAPSAAH